MKYITPLLAGLAFLMAATALINTRQADSVVVDNLGTESIDAGAIRIVPESLRSSPEQPSTAEQPLSSEELHTTLLKVEQQLQQQNSELQALRSELKELKSSMPPTTDADREYADLMRDLPPDFENRIKTDPDYAENMQTELLTKVIDHSLGEEERLRAVQQLMMVSGSIGTFSQIQQNPDLDKAMTQLFDHASQESTRIKALEYLSFMGTNNIANQERFLNLVVNDSNRYVRNLATDALSSMLYSAEINEGQRSELIQKISNLMDNSDETTQSLLKERFGSTEQLQQFEQDVRDETLNLPQ